MMRVYYLVYDGGYAVDYDGWNGVDRCICYVD